MNAELDAEFASFATSGSCETFSPQEAFWSTTGWASQSDGIGLAITLVPLDVMDRPREFLRTTDPADFERHAVLDEDVTFGN